MVVVGIEDAAVVPSAMMWSARRPSTWPPAKFPQLWPRFIRFAPIIPSPSSPTIKIRIWFLHVCVHYPWLILWRTARPMFMPRTHKCNARLASETLWRYTLLAGGIQLPSNPTRRTLRLERLAAPRRDACARSGEHRDSSARRVRSVLWRTPHWWKTDLAVSRPIMVMLIAGGSLSTGSHDPYSGTQMPLGPSTPPPNIEIALWLTGRFYGS